MLHNRLEERVQEFWEVSKAWRGESPYADNQTFQTIIERLNPLTNQGEFHQLRAQAESLTDLAVKGKRRRKKGTIKGKVVRVNFKPEIAGQVNNPCSEILLPHYTTNRY